MIATQTSDQRFWDKIAKKYARNPIKDQPAYEKKITLTQTYLTPESRVLEFGCGTGSTALRHASRVAHIHATDISKNMIAIAQDKREQSGVKNVTFEQATLEQIKVEEPYDVILGLNILHLLDDPSAAIKRCHSFLKPGGKLITSTGILTRANILLQWILPIVAVTGLIPKVNIFSEKTLVRNMEQAGFKILSNDTFNKNGLSAFIVAEKV